MGLFGKFLTTKKFTDEERGLIDDFVLDASSDFKKHGYTINFKRDRDITKPENIPKTYTETPRSSHEVQTTDRVVYELLYQNKKITKYGQQLTFVKYFYFSVLSKSLIRINIDFYGRDINPYSEGIIVEGNHYETKTFKNYKLTTVTIDPKEFFDHMRGIFVKKMIEVVKNKEKWLK